MHFWFLMIVWLDGGGYMDTTGLIESEAQCKAFAQARYAEMPWLYHGSEAICIGEGKIVRFKL